MGEQGRAALAGLKAQKKAADDFANANKNNKNATRRVAAAKQASTLANGQIAAIEAANKNLQQLNEIVAKLNNKKLSYSIFLDADGAKNYMSKPQ